MTELSIEQSQPEQDTTGVVPVRVGLYVLTLLSAGAALFVEPALAGAVSRGAISPRWLFLPIGVYGLFLTVYAFDRAWLVRRRRYPAGKAFFQVAFGLVFASVLLPSTIQDYKAHRPSGVARMLSHPDPTVREVAVFALGFKGAGEGRAERVVEMLQDRNQTVRDAAEVVLRQWSGRADASRAELETWARTLDVGTSTASGGDR